MHDALKVPHLYASRRVFDGTRQLSPYQAECLQANYYRQMRKPEALLALGRYDEACLLILNGLHAHYLESITMGRIDVWKKAAISSVELLADVPRPTPRAMVGFFMARSN